MGLCFPIGMMKRKVLLMVMAALAVVLVASCVPLEKKIPRVLPNKTMEVKELTKDDVFLLMDRDEINSSFVKVKGVGIGDSDESVITKLGRPKSFESFEQGSVNLRFEDPMTNDTEFIVHIDDGKVERIAIKPGFYDEIPHLRLNYTKEEVTLAFGKPTRVSDTKFYHIYEYDDLGLEIYLKARKMAGFGLIRSK